MPKSHGWTDEAARNYAADKANRDLDQRIRDFRERSTMIAASYSGDPKGYDVEYSRLCEANADLADDVSEIADYFAEQHRLAQMEFLHRD